MAGAAAAAPAATAASEPAWEAILPVARDLRADGEAATASRKPLLLFFNLSGCPYCRLALREAIVPMFRNAQWRDRIEFRQITIDDGGTLIDFDGQRINNREFARLRKGSFTPTVMLVDGSGQRLGDAIVGIANADFYGVYVEELASKAVAEMRTRR
jgi:thioredoxin-related protein